MRKSRFFNAETRFLPVKGTDYTAVHLAVDVQLGCIMGMTSEGAKRYLDNLGEKIESFRQKGIPTVWITVGDSNRLSPAGSQSGRGKMNADKIEEFDFYTVGPHAVAENIAPVKKHFDDFMDKYGPRANEDLFAKRFLDAFMDDKTIKDNPALIGHLLTHRRDETVENIQTAAGSASLTKYLQEKNTKEVLISGFVSDVCVLETAIGASRNGMKAAILTDCVGSYQDRKFCRTPDFYHNQIQDVLNKIMHNPSALADDPTKMAYTDDILPGRQKQDMVKNIKLAPAEKAINELKSSAPETSSPRSKALESFRR